LAHRIRRPALSCKQDREKSPTTHDSELCEPESHTAFPRTSDTREGACDPLEGEPCSESHGIEIPSTPERVGESWSSPVRSRSFRGSVAKPQICRHHCWYRKSGAHLQGRADQAQESSSRVALRLQDVLARLLEFLLGSESPEAASSQQLV